MRVDEIEIHTGTPAFPFTPVRRLEAKCEARSNFSPAPTMDEVNAKMREMAIGLGANAIVDVQYTSGASMTSWRSMRGTGLAVRRVADERPCPACAETIKAAAIKCRFCGADVEPLTSTASSAPAPATLGASHPAPAGTAADALPPLRSTNNPQGWLIAVAVLVLLGVLVSAL
jgi:hypothetical protein